MAKCGFWYKDYWYSTSEELISDLKTDSSSLMTPSGSFKPGFDMTDFVKTFKLSRTELQQRNIDAIQTKVNEYESRLSKAEGDVALSRIKSILTSLERDLVQAKAKLKKANDLTKPLAQSYQSISSPIPISKGYTLAKRAVSKVKLNVTRADKSLTVTEEKALMETIKGNYIRLFLEEFNKTRKISSSKDTQFLEEGARNLTVKHLESLRRETEMLDAELSKNVEDYVQDPKMTRLLKNLDTVLGDDNAILSNLSVEAEQSALSQLGYRLTQVDDAEALFIAETDEQQAYQNRFFSIEINPSENLDSFMKAKLSVFHRWELANDENGELVPVPTINAFGGDVYDYLAVNKTQDLLSKGVRYSYAEKLEIINEKVAELMVDPKKDMGNMFLLELAKSLNAPLSKNGFTFAEKMTFSKVMDTDINNIKGIDFDKKTGTLFIKDYNFSNKFNRVVSQFSSNILGIIGTDNVGKLKDLREGQPMEENMRMSKDNPTMKEFILASRTLNRKRDKKREYLNSLSVQDLSSLMKGYSTFSLSLENNLAKHNQAYMDFTESEGRKQPLIDLTEYRDTHKVVPTRVTENLIKLGRENRMLISSILAERVADTMKTLRFNLNPSATEIIRGAVATGELTNVIEANGSVMSDTMTVSDSINYFINAINQKLDDPHKGMSSGIKTFLNWATQKIGVQEDGTTIQIGSRKVASKNIPIPLYTEFKRLRSEQYRDNYENDIYATGSRIFNLIKNGSELGKLSYGGEIFGLPSRSGLKPTHLHKEGESVSPTAESIFRHSMRFKTLQLGNKLGGLDYLGAQYDNITDTIGEQDYDLNVRKGIVASPTFSNKGHLFSVTSLDFDSVSNVVDGVPQFKKTYVKYLVDSLLVPEFNRFKATRTRNVQNEGYNGNLIYTIPSLNVDNKIQKLLRTLNIQRKGQIESLFDDSLTQMNSENSKKVENLKELRELAIESMEKMLQEETQKAIDKLEKNKVISRDGNTYQLGGKVQDLDVWKALTKDSKGVEADPVPADTRNEIGIKAIEVFPKIVTADGLIDSIPLINTLKNLGVLSETSYNGVKYEIERHALPSNKVLEYVGFGKLTETQLKKLGAVSVGPFTTPPPTVQEAYEMMKSAAVNEGIRYPNNLTSVFAERAGLSLVNMDTFVSTIATGEFSNLYGLGNMYQTIFGDIAGEFKRAKNNPNNDILLDIEQTKANNAKRLARFVSPTTPGEGGNKFSFIVTAEPSRPSPYYNGNNGLQDVKDIDYSDAGSYTTVKSHIAFKVQEGSLAPEHIPATLAFLEGTVVKDKDGNDTGKRKYISGTEFTKRTELPISAVTDVFMKPKGTGFENRPVLTQGGNETGYNLRHSMYLKTGMTTLVPAWSGSNPNNKLVQRRLAMERLEASNNEGLDLAKDYDKWHMVGMVPESGLKTGLPAVLAEFDDVSSSVWDVGSSTITFDMSEMGRQQVTAVKGAKQKAFSGQMENALWNAINDATFNVVVDGKRVNAREAWEKIHKDRHEVGMEELKKILYSSGDMQEMKNLLAGVENLPAPEKADTENHQDLIDSVKDTVIASLIKSSFDRQGKQIRERNPLIDIYLQTNAQGKFIYDITKADMFQEFMDRIRVEIESKTVKAKQPISEFSLSSALGVDLNDPTQEYLLFPGVEYGPNGTLKPKLPGGQKAQILMPFTFTYYEDGKSVTAKASNFVGTDGKIDVNKLPMEVLNGIAYRTPTQGYSMISDVEIVGFLPESMGNTVIAPIEFVALMGSDFDGDKLNMYHKELTKVTNADGTFTIKEVNSKNSTDPKMRKAVLNNRKMQVLEGILSDDTITKDHVISSLNREEDFKPIAAFIKDISRELDLAKGSFLSSTYQQEGAEEAEGAGLGTAVYAKLLRVFSQIQHVQVPMLAIVDGVNGLETVESPLLLGGQRIDYLGQDGAHMFKRNPDAEHEEKFYDNIGNNISVLLSMFVDNETLKLVYPLGITENLYDTMSGLVLSGFNTKTATLMINLPFFKLETSLDQQNYMREMYDMYRQETGQELTDEELTQHNLSFYSPEMTENQFTRGVKNLLEKAENPIALSGYDYKDLAILADIGERATAAYNLALAPTSRLFNYDSKGFPRDIAKLEMDANISDNPKLAAVWDQLKDVTEIKFSEVELQAFSTRINSLLTADTDLTDVLQVMRASNIPSKHIRELSSFVLSQQLKSRTPNVESLRKRLSNLLHDNEYYEFHKNNYFLQGISLKGNEITFNKPSDIELRDILIDFEALNQDEYVGDIHLGDLFRDLVNYSLTTTFSKGNTFEHLIHPKYKVIDKADASMSPEKIAALYAFHTGQHESVRGELRYDPERKVIVSTDRMNSMIVGMDDLRARPDDSPLVSKAIEEGVVYNPDSVDIEKSIERIFVEPEDKPLRKFLQGIFKVKNPSVIKSSYRSSWNQPYGRMSLRYQNNDTLKVVKDRITHESVHMTLDESATAYLDGNLAENYPDTTEQGQSVATEMVRVFQSLEGHMESVTTGLAKRALDDIKGQQKGNPPSNFVPYVPALHGYMSANFLGTFNYKDLLDFFEPGELKNDYGIDVTRAVSKKNENIIVMTAVMKAIQNGSITTVPRTAENKETVQAGGKYLGRDRKLALVTPQGKVLEGYMSSDTNINTMVDTFTEAADLLGEKKFIEELADYSVSDLTPEGKDERRWFGKMAYGVSSLKEFMASSYEIGMGTTYAGYQQLNYGYNAAYTNMPKGIAAAIKGAFDLIKELLDLMFGTKKLNETAKDVTYLTTLDNIPNFTTFHANEKVQWRTTDLAEEIKKCKS